MRHQRVINHLGRTSSHRKAMLANMASSLILHKRITTTTAKAKALRTFVEPLITKSKEDSTHSRRMVFGYLKDKEAVSELFREVSPKIAERPGGYTRILKTGNRIGDNAEMCILELVDYNENMLGGKAASAKTTRRKRSTKKKTEGTETNAPVVAETTAKAPAGKAKKSSAPEAETTEKQEESPEE
jgi:large subunit ribosomal protein L17